MITLKITPENTKSKICTTQNTFFTEPAGDGTLSNPQCTYFWFSDT